MIKLKQRLMLYVSALLLLSGCMHDSFNGGRLETGDDPMSFTFSIDGMTTKSATRAAISPIDGETTVDSLYLLFFTASDDRSGTLAGTVTLPGGQGTAGKLTMETSYVLPETGGINSGDAYHVIGIANLEKYVDDASDWLLQWNGQTESYFRDNATVEREGTVDESDYTTHRPIQLDALLMNGYVDKPAGTKNMQMVLTRNVARIDVQNNAPSHTLKTASVWNAFTRSSVTGDATFDYTSEALHTQRFYGIECPVSPGDIVEGGLYAFANYSESPVINDKTTTCLVVGLSPTGGGATRYYRVNVNSAGAPQNLKDNYSHKITILSVTGQGYSTENEAWEGTTNQLVYVVNNWDLDDNGLIVSDEYSILALPVKTVKIGPQGGENSYSVTTFSTLANPEPLRIKSQLYEPVDGNINARISNGNLVIDAQPMSTGQTERSGIITVSFAGLEAIVNVLQTATGDIYLEVTLDDGWKEFLPPTANAMSEYVFVNASGPWTARLFGSGNLAFMNSQGQYVRQISSVNFPNNKFHVYTSTANVSITDTEKGFVMVSLDSDPDNYISVVPVGQSPRGGIDTDPPNLSAIRFYGSGNLETTTGNQIASLTQYMFTVSSLGTIGDVTLGGSNYDKFDFIYDRSSGNITVWAKERNNTSNNYTATLQINDNRNGMLEVNLTQGTSDLIVVPTARRVPATGGDSDVINVSIEGGGVKWTATVTTVTNGSRAIFNHNAEVLTANGAPIPPEGTDENLKVRFPKIYFPNRETEIKAIVTVTPTSGGSYKTCEVYQEKLASKGVNIWNLRGSSYGSLNGDHYIDSYRDAIRAFPGSFTNNTAANPPAAYPSTTTYIHLGNQFPSGFTWTTVNNFRNNVDGIIVLTNDAEDLTSMSKANEFLNPLGYGSASAGSASAISLISNQNYRVIDFLTTQGKTAISYSQLTTNFFGDGIGTYISTNNIPTSGIPVFVNSVSSNQAYLIIDPEKKFVFIGEVQVFDTGGNLTNNRDTFMNNFVQYVANAAKYGSHFTDMLREDLSSTIPAMWDTSVWGTNAWPGYSD